MVKTPNRNEIDEQMGVGEGGGKLGNLGKKLKTFAIGLEGIINGTVTLNEEAFTPVVFGSDEYAELLSNENAPWDLSDDTTVTFEIDDSAQTEITFSEGDYIEDINAVTVEEAVAHMQDAIETAEEDDAYWAVEQNGQIRVYSLNDTITDNKVEINDTDAGQENTTLGFDDNDVDYGKQSIGSVEEMENDEYFVDFAELDYTDVITISEISENGFRLTCDDTSATDDVRLLVIGDVE